LVAVKHVLLAQYTAFPTNGADLYEELLSSTAILSTGNPSLDKLLDSGLYTGEVTELIGTPGSGKTQMEALRRIQVRQVFSVFSLFEAQQDLRSSGFHQVAGGSGSVKVVIVDSVAAVLSPIIGSRQTEGLSLMMQLAALGKSTFTTTEKTSLNITMTPAEMVLATEKEPENTQTTAYFGLEPTAPTVSPAREKTPDWAEQTSVSTSLKLSMEMKHLQEPTLHHPEKSQTTPSLSPEPASSTISTAQKKTSDWAEESISTAVKLSLEMEDLQPVPSTPISARDWTTTTSLNLSLTETLSVPEQNSPPSSVGLNDIIPTHEPTLASKPDLQPTLLRSSQQPAIQQAFLQPRSRNTGVQPKPKSVAMPFYSIVQQGQYCDDKVGVKGGTIQWPEERSSGSVLKYICPVGTYAYPVNWRVCVRGRWTLLRNAYGDTDTVVTCKRWYTFDNVEDLTKEIQMVRSQIFKSEQKTNERDPLSGTTHHILFLLDSSVTVGWYNFQRGLEFIDSTIDVIWTRKVLIQVICYDNFKAEKIDVMENPMTGRPDPLADSTDYSGFSQHYGTNIYRALDAVLKSVQRAQANRVKWTIFLIGLGSVDRVQLESIIPQKYVEEGGRQYTFYLPSYDTLRLVYSESKWDGMINKDVSSAKTIGVKQLILHPQYNKDYDYDMALLELAQEISYSDTVSPALSALKPHTRSPNECSVPEEKTVIPVKIGIVSYGKDLVCGKNNFMGYYSNVPSMMSFIRTHVTDLQYE
ncbi:DNA repair protein RAD51-like 4, partial [Acipenser ruthenus]